MNGEASKLDPGSSHSPDQEAGLLEGLQLCWQMRLQLWSELKALLAAETRLAVKSSLQLLLGVLAIFAVAGISVLLIEVLLLSALVEFGLSPASALLLIIVFNAIVMAKIFYTIRRLPENLAFAYSREAINSSVLQSPSAREDAKSPDATGEP